MYTDYFELQDLPFENTPDPRFFYGSEQHHEALAAIEYTIRLRKGFALITGDVGSGKTTVAHTMMHRCEAFAHVVQLVHGLRTASELLHQAFNALDTPFQPGEDDADLRFRLRATLQQHADAGRPVVLLIDEAQTLSDDALEELRLMSNFDTDTDKLVQVVLIGQPELRQHVMNLPALRQRIAIAKQIKPLSLEASYHYIIHRLRSASADGKSVKVRFTAEAMSRLHTFAKGAPRMINFICDNCLVLLFAKGESHRITDAIVKQVIADLLPEAETKTAAMPRIVTRPQAANEMTASRVAA